MKRQGMRQIVGALGIALGLGAVPAIGVLNGLVVQAHVRHASEWFSENKDGRRCYWGWSETYPPQTGRALGYQGQAKFLMGRCAYNGGPERNE